MGCFRGVNAALRTLPAGEVSLAVLHAEVDSRHWGKNWIGGREAHRANGTGGRDTFANELIGLPTYQHTIYLRDAQRDGT